MDVNEIINKKISILSDKITIASDDISSNNLRKADYDKTLIGWVSQKIVPETPKDDNDFKWRIQTNGVAYDIKPSACNITSVGQRVRLYVPNHSYKDKYAEVINEIFTDENLINVTKVSDNEICAIYKNPLNDDMFYKQTITAEGSGNKRYNFKQIIEEVTS